MGKSSSQKQDVTEYRMSIHFGVCLGADAVTRIRVNDKEAWSGDSSILETISINKPDLFGGQQKEGGLVGNIVHLPGKPDQVMPDDLANRLGVVSGELCPAFRGITTLFFTGNGTSIRGSGGGLVTQAGEALGAYQAAAGGQGFLWSYNNPIIAQSVDVTVRRTPKTGLNPATAKIGVNANPAHMIYEVLVNPQWGMGALSATIDHTSFNNAAQTLLDETFGLSIMWTRQDTIENFISEILDHIQAVLFLSPRSGLWTLKLIRDDYDITDLRVIDENNATMTNFSRRTWGEAANEITVSFTNPENEQTETVTAQDLASVVVQGGPISDSRNYYGVRDRGLAMRLAQRDVRSSAAPLAQATVEVDRTAWDVEPGEVLAVNWPEYELNGVVCRIMNVDYGSPDDMTIKLALLEDIFSLEKPPAVIPSDPSWQPPGSPPEPLAATEIITLPAYMAASGDFQTNAVDLEYPEVLAGTLGYQDKPDTYTYELLSNDVTSTGANAFVSHGTKTVIERTVLPTALGAADESRLQDALFLNKTRRPTVGGFVFFGVGSDDSMEIGHVVDYVDGTDEWVIARGVLDTVPRDWTPGTPVWVLNRGDRIVDDRMIRSAGEEVEYKFLTRTARGVLPAADADVVTENLTARPHLPLRPADVAINDQGFGSIAAQGVTDLHITWATRNRFLEDGLVLRWDDGPAAPEHAQGTRIVVYDQDGNDVYNEFGLWTELEKTLPLSYFARYSQITVAVGSHREDLESLQRWSMVITGLPADPGAPPPPTPPDHGPPPNVDPAPAVGAWSATGSEFVLDSAGKVVSAVPAILVSGKRDRPDAIGLIVRYRKTGSNDWFYLSELALDDNPTQTATTAVAAQTAYDVQVAYRSDKNVLSMWRDLGEVTTGVLIAGGIGDLTAQQVKEALEFLDQIDEDALAALGDLSEITSGIKTNAEAILALNIRGVEDKLRFESLTHEVDADGNPIPIGTALRTERETRISETEAFDAIFTAFGAWNDDKSAWILNGQTVWVNEEMSWAQYTQDIVSNFGDVYSTIQLNQETNASANQATADELHALGVGVNNNTAFLIDQNKLLVNSDGTTFAQRMQAQQVYTDEKAATILQQARTYTDTSAGAFASVLTTLNVSASGFAATITNMLQVDTLYGAKAAMRFDVNGHITGWVALNNGNQGGFTFVADYFNITTPNGDVTPFSVQGDGVHMTDVTVHKLQAESVVANSIRGGAVSTVTVAQSSGPIGLAGGEIMVHTHTVAAEGGSLVISVNTGVGQSGNGVSGASCRIVCRETGATIGQAAQVFPGPFALNITFNAYDHPGPGTYHYDIYMSRTAGSTAANQWDGTNTIVTELKK